MIAMVFALTSSAQSVPDNWFVDEVNPGEDIALYPCDEMAQEGMYSCKMELLQAEVPYLISDNYDVTAGDTYTFSIWYYDNDDRGELKFYAEFYDAEGNDIYGEDPVYSVDADEWQQVTWTAVVPDDAVEGYVWIKFYETDNYVDMALAYVDNAEFIVSENNLVMNGSFEEWPGLGINPVQESAFSVYPNPVKNYISVAGNDYQLVKLINALGQEVASFDKSSNYDISGLDEGLYFVQLINEDKIIATEKIMKQ
jgi:hypothetical protein